MRQFVFPQKMGYGDTITYMSRFVRLLVGAALIGVALSSPLLPTTLYAQNSTRYDLGFGPSFSAYTSANHGVPANYDWAANGGRYSSVPCSDGLPGLKDGHCGEPSLPFGEITNSLGLCANDRSVSCIESLEISTGGKWIPAIAESDIPACCKRPASVYPVTWSSISDFDIGATNKASLFRLDGVVDVPRLWYVVAFYKFNIYNLKSPNPRPQNYTVEVAPVELIPASQVNWNSGSRHLWISDDAYLRVVNDKGFETRLTLNLKSEPSTWLRTYLTESSAEVARSTSQSDRFLLRVAGKSSRLPSASMSVAYSDNARREKLCSTWTSKTGFCGPDNAKSWGVIYSTLGTQSISPKTLFDEYAKKIDLFPELDRATKEEDFWLFSFSMTNPRQLQGCPLASGIYGLVGGNSMLISDEVPLWNQEAQALEFTVASPHYRPNGKTAEGFYEMQLNEKVAQCLWGTTITPQNVSLSVLDKDGETKVAVASIAVQKGMVIFSASGFSYSVSTLRASLKKPETAKEAEKIKPAQRISCTKNGVTKVQPKGATSCPKGWRKKK